SVFSEHARTVRLPTYPWQRQRHWIEAQPARLTAGGARSGVWPLAGASLDVPGAVQHNVIRLSVREQPYLAHHVIYGRIVVPAALYMGVMLSIAAELWPDRPLEITEAEFTRAITMGAAEDIELHAVIAEQDEAGGRRVELV